MKIKGFILILAILLLSPSQTTSSSVWDDSNNSNQEVISTGIQLDQIFEDLSRPIFLSAEGNDQREIRSRNDTEGSGAIIQNNLNTNVTLLYAVINGDANTTIRLYPDVPGNYSLERTAELNQSLAFTFVETTFEANYTLPYTDLIQPIRNATFSVYSVEINVTADYIPFYAAITDGPSEDDLESPHNLITTKQNWDTRATDAFFLQIENVNITLSAFNVTNEDVFGISWRSSNTGNFVDQNFTIAISGSNGSSSIDLGQFEIDTNIEWRSYAVLNDTAANLTRTIQNVEHRFVEVGDGTPSISVSVFSEAVNALQVGDIFYSSDEEITFNFSASVVKGNISEFLFIQDVSTPSTNLTIAPTVNASLLGEEMSINATYFQNSIVNSSIIAFTDKGLSVNTTLQVVIDNTSPEVAFTSEIDRVIVTKTGIVAFEFDFTDVTAGVFVAVLDLGDGNSVEVTKLGSYAHTYLDRDESYLVTLTVIDWAGNSLSVTSFIELKPASVGEESGPIFAELVILLAFIAIVALLYMEKTRTSITGRFDRFRKS